MPTGNCADSSHRLMSAFLAAAPPQVREMLLYTAELKSSHKESRQAKIDRVDDVIAKLQLEVWPLASPAALWGNATCNLASLFCRGRLLQSYRQAWSCRQARWLINAAL